MVKIKSTSIPPKRNDRPYTRVNMIDIIDYWSRENSFINMELYLRVLEVKTTRE